MNPYAYDALNVKQNFDQKRSDANFALQLEQLTSDKSDQEAQKNSQALNLISQYSNATSEAMRNLLPQDAKKVSDKELQLRAPILDALKKSGVDADHFMMNQGHAMLDNYANQIANSEELKTGMLNKKNALEILSDKASGKIPRDPNTDQYLADFQSGKRKDIPYGGAINPLKADITEFTKIPSPSGEGSTVSEPYLKQWIKYKGGYNDADAQRIYDTQYKGVQIPWGAPKQVPYGSTKAGFEERFGLGSASNKDNQDMPLLNKLANLPNKNNVLSNAMTGLIMDNSTKDKLNPITSSGKTIDGNYAVYFKDGTSRQYKTPWQAYEIGILNTYPSTANTILQNAARTAWKYGYAKKIGAPPAPGIDNEPEELPTQDNNEPPTEGEERKFSEGEAIFTNGAWILKK